MKILYYVQFTTHLEGYPNAMHNSSPVYRSLEELHRKTG